MRYSVNWTYILATYAEHYASIWILDDCSLFPVFFLKFEDLIVAVVNAFPASNALVIVNFWRPRYFFSRYSLIFFLNQSFLPP